MLDKEFDAYVNTVLDWYRRSTEAEQKQFKEMSKEDLCLYHHSLGRQIRNQFNLWSFPWEEKIVNGVDYSPDHPDAISMRIIEKVWELANKER